MLVLWQLVVTGFGVPTYIAPSPVQVLQVFVEQGDLLWINFWPTLLEAMTGFALGNTVAVLLAVWFVHNRLAERAFYPIAVFVNTIPIIAVAPILVLMLGNGYAPKIVIAALICFFPTLVNMVRGLKAVSPQMLDLMRVLSASDREALWKIRLQSSLPFLFAALKIASTTCVIGAVVGEWTGPDAAGEDRRGAAGRGLALQLHAGDADAGSGHVDDARSGAELGRHAPVRGVRDHRRGGGDGRRLQGEPLARHLPGARPRRSVRGSPVRRPGAAEGASAGASGDLSRAFCRQHHRDWLERLDGVDLLCAPVKILE